MTAETPYSQSLGGGVGIGFVKLDVPLTTTVVNEGNGKFEVAGRRVAAAASLRPLYDAGMEKTKC